MDRDEKWDRIKKAYRLYVYGEGTPIEQASFHIKDSYKKDIYDAFIEPAFIKTPEGKPTAVIKNNDAIIFSNFREDSMRKSPKHLSKTLLIIFRASAFKISMLRQ
jgi:2,3-bisphosphoglycerate-independent phosphoglycerate mutase